MRTRSHCQIVALLVFSCVAFANISLAGEIGQTDAGIVWQAGIDGVEIEWAPDGSFNRIYSRYTQPVAIPDRQGISKAQIIAEEKAKAAIIRFNEQNVASARVVGEIQNDMNQTTSSKDGGKASAISKTSQRQMIESLSEVTSSAAAGKLRGVIVLERGYDEKEGVAWVKVGISQKTALFPEHKPLDFLLERKKLLTQPSWESIYQQNPIVVGGGQFPIDKMKVLPVFIRDTL
jgi:hypothetical protein